MKIGSVELSSPLIVAPMAGVTDLPFRCLCRKHGAGMAVSEMIDASPLLRKSKKTMQRSAFEGEPSPRCAQLVGRDPELMADAAVYLVDCGADIIDINMGCPVKKLLKKKQGAWLLQEVSQIKKIIRATVNAVSVPVTIKIRTGWSREDNVAVEIAKIAQDEGVSAVTVHGRTAITAWNEPAEYDTVAQVKAQTEIPVIANGDIQSAQIAYDVLKKTGVDGLMLGRAVFGRPWIFQEISAISGGQEVIKPVALSEIHAILISHLNANYCFYGEKQGVRISRKHIRWYLNQLDMSEVDCKAIFQAENSSSQKRWVNNLFTDLRD